jgi:pyruvate,water dikinase
MSRLLERLSTLFRPGPRPGPDELRAAFRAHYRSFRSLLTANNDALEVMAEMEAALHSGEPFGMAFVRGKCTAAGVAVYRMVQALLELSGGRYRDLPERLRGVTGGIEAILSRHPEPAGTRLVLALEEIDRRAVDEVGDKLANLGEIRNRLGLRVPEGFAVTAAASRHFLEATELQVEINRRLKTLDPDDLEALYDTSTAIQRLIGAAPLPPDLAHAMDEQYRRLAERTGATPRVALRSSALGEDGRQASFAGQYRTRLDVRPELLGHHYKGIVAGKYRGQAIVYRQQRGYRHQDVLMCVGCLAMVDAAVSGVAYSRPPDDPRSPWIVVHAAPGLGTEIVEGTSPYDLYRVGREPPHELGARRVRAGAEAACLTDDQLRELARAAARIEEHFGTPQDVEWSFDRAGRLFLLQARPLGSAPVQAEPPSPPLGAGEEGEGGRAILSGGVTASRGVGCGPVYRVRSALDVLDFPRGAVLVVQTPDPDWAVLMSRAAAVVSASGQIATHLATVAREFAVPALFDVPGAFDELVPGRVVTVDATSRRVHEGRVEALLRSPAPRPNLMEGSPIHRLLREALGLVTPLNLTAPDSPRFKPSSCRTLHDVTRFCHEKAVAEMFGFGARHGFSEKAAKRLVVDGAPSQWWVIDLEDGLRPGTDPASRFVAIEDVVSEPMRALWTGMTAVPWSGPPPVSLRGFGAIVAQSTMNPQLDPAVRSRLATPNYFLVARSFCNLSVRLGYHFALAEASFSDLLAESYVNFQFKGGAADERRRRRRVRLLAETLRDVDFRVETTGDALTARIEKRPVPFLRERLVVLGYLLIHTRQIDMVMDEQAFVERYRARIDSDIRTIRARLAAGA